MIWPFNFAERKAYKLGNARIMLTGYENRLKRIQSAMNSGNSYPFGLLDEEQETMRKVAEWRQQIIGLGGEVKP